MATTKKTPAETGKRPKPRDKVLSARVPPAIYRAAMAKARKERRRLSWILRALIDQWTAGTLPTPPPAPDEATRAKMRAASTSVKKSTPATSVKRRR